MNLILRILKKLQSYYYYYFKKYNYKEFLYKDAFISKMPKIKGDNLKLAPEIIYTFWTGSNELTPNRKKGLESLKKNTEVEVKLITPKNLPDYILSEYPLHKTYKYLSLNHRSDYLRCYFMLHYGGGYADIKLYKYSWKNAFKKLNENPTKWALGYRELGAWGTPKLSGKLGEDLKKYYLFLIGNGAFIYKPNSPIAKEWYCEIHRRLDNYYEKLKKNPAEDAFGSNENYPIPWAHLTGEIHHPLVLKYFDKTLKSNDVLPSMKNYR